MTPQTMRGVLLLGHGGLDRLQYREDLPVPEPVVGEVLIQVGAAGINNTDLNLRTGWYSKSADTSGRDAGWAGDAAQFPRIQGADACGRIVAVGTGVNAARVGERVLVNPFIASNVGSTEAVAYLGSDRDGAFAEFMTVPSPNACCLTSPLSDVELASFPCSYSAAENLLTRAQVRAGETVLVTGASGGVGSALVQLARRRSARVIAVAGDQKGAAVKSLGADRIVARDANLTTLLGHESVDAVLDAVGGSQFSSMLEVLRPRGRYAVAGAIAGPHVDLDLRTLYLKDLTLIGCTRLEPEIFGNLIGYIERSEIQPVVSAIYRLNEIAAAQTAFAAKQHVGKIVLVP